MKPIPIVYFVSDIALMTKWCAHALYTDIYSDSFLCTHFSL